ncbi:hypothetical protein JR316_0006693 [Psilocybe cubensis]|uniref:Uncharacterized protein n=2 Tax=Psilocybe cubensis TaxID=181762 RepID=A0A8H7XLJ3_PSICU|nr:hypothetical protein JR316_0006693 [Psilocybe cubensis]KAH9480096.1 hypothetical protein JR316_0006693 [Psilocybe cubensis]
MWNHSLGSITIHAYQGNRQPGARCVRSIDIIPLKPVTDLIATDTLALSPEICSRIVALSAHRRRDLLSLCATCKAFQRDAEVKIYTEVILAEPAQALIACETLGSNERLAQYVKSFCFNQEFPPRRLQDTNLGRPFWESVQRALIAMSNLEVLLISDSSYQNSWILDSPNINFQLQEVKLRFTWDEPIVRFLETQNSLRNIHFYYFDDSQHVLQPQSLPELRVFDGSLSIGMQVMHCQLTHIQLVVDCDAGPALSLLPRLGGLRKTLRGLSLLDISDDAALSALDIISRYLPNLIHVGLFAYPALRRYEFHQYLMRMPRLEIIEVDVGRWLERPTTSAGQRALASELRTYVPTIKMVVFWIVNSKYTWTHHDSINQWDYMAQSRQYPQLSNTWCLV